MPEENLPDCDYSRMKLPKPTRAQARPSVGELSDLDVAKLVVGAALKNKSQAAVLQTAVLTYISRTWPNDLERLHIVANREGIAIEEAFTKILNGELEP